MKNKIRIEGTLAVRRFPSVFFIDKLLRIFNGLDIKIIPTVLYLWPIIKHLIESLFSFLI